MNITQTNIEKGCKKEKREETIKIDSSSNPVMTSGKYTNSNEKNLNNNSLSWKNYCPLNWLIIPLDGKKPIIAGWQKLNEQLCLDNHGGNIGVLCGKVSGITIIDIDKPKGGEIDGEVFINKLFEDNGYLHFGPIQRSGSGALHYVFKYNPKLKNSVRGLKLNNSEGIFSISIDVLNNGKQFVVSPSIHPETKNKYEWEQTPFDYSPEDMPDFLTNILNAGIIIEKDEIYV